MLSKGQARTFFLGGTFVFSAAFLGLTFDTHRHIPAQTNADQITEEVIAGKHIWEKNNCMGCHTLFGEGAYYAPELTKTVDRRGEPWLKAFLKDPQAMFTRAGARWCSTISPTRRSSRSSPSSTGRAKSTSTVSRPIRRCATHSAQRTTTVNAPVEARDLSRCPRSSPPARACGCHKIAGKGGAAGELIGAPPLDGVHQRKTREELIEWITDPQKVKPGTTMPELVRASITEQQVDEIVDYLPA